MLARKIAHSGRAAYGTRSGVALVSFHTTSISMADPGRNEGATGGSKEFGARERSEESRYVRAKEAAALKLLREQIAAQKKATEELEKQAKDLEKQHKQ